MKWEPLEPSFLTIWIIFIKNVNSPKTDQFLIVHYHNYLLYAKYNINQKEKMSGTRLYLLLIKLIMVIGLSGVQFGQ